MHVNGETGEETQCELVFKGHSADGVAQWIIGTDIDYVFGRGDKVHIAVLPPRTNLALTMTLPDGEP